MFFHTFLPKLLNMSLTAGVAIVLVILLRLLLKKAPKVISYGLWGVVLFRLLCPVSIGSGLSFYNLFDAPTERTGTMTSVIEYVPSDIVEYPSVALPAPGVSDGINETLPQGQLAADLLEAPMSFYIWMAGVWIMAIYSIVSYIRLRRRLSIAVPLRENICIADDIRSPFVVGLFRPKIYLPCNLGDREQEYIILHEQHHIRHFDHVVKALAFLALTVHWFNPLVWAAFILAGKDMEMRCDEAVVRKMGEGIRADYSASLLTLATGRRIIAGTPLAFGEGDTKGRIKNLANWRKPTSWVIIPAAIVCVVATVCLLTNPSTSRQPPAGMVYTYEGEGFGSAFQIAVKKDGTFTYYEGMLSSYIGYGAWSVSEDILTLTDETGTGHVNHFRIDGERLVFIEKGSGNFLHVKVEDGAVFHGAALTDAADGGKFYLTIGAEGATSIEITTPNTSGGCQNAGGSPFEPGERVWLEALDGVPDLRGVGITAYNEAGEVIWTASVPDTEENRGVTHLAVNGWTITSPR